MKVNQRLLTLTAVICIICVSFFACKKDYPYNPFDDIVPDPGDTTVVVNLDPTTIEGLHYYIFKPTCANSGCHDGTFEPDFRTIESSYNTLVYHPIIKNDTLMQHTYRVAPGDISKSILYYRLTTILDAGSELMPLVVDPGNDWNSKKDQYISNIETWIMDGAKDIFGNAPVLPNNEPEMLGLVAFANGSGTPVSRQGATGPMVIPGGTTSLEIWISLNDDVTPTPSLTYNKIKFSDSMNNFEPKPEETLTVVGTPISETGYAGPAVNYYHKITINPATYGSSGTLIFIRVYVKDPEHDVTEIPEYGSAVYIKSYFSFIIN